MYIVQTITQARLNRDERFDRITTLGLFGTVDEAHQAATDYCQDGNLYHETICPDGEARVVPGCGTTEGKYWKKIAPMGYYATWSGQKVWVRIESVKERK